MRKKVATKRRRQLFLDTLIETGSVTQAAIAGELSRRTFYYLRDRDREFDQAWQDAEAVFLDKVEGEAIKRAVLGVDEDKPYTHLDKKGSKETRLRTVNTRSDRLLELILVSRHSCYRRSTAPEPPHPGDNPGLQAPQQDYKNLSDDELLTLVRLQRKANASGQGTA